MTTSVGFVIWWAFFLFSPPSLFATHSQMGRYIMKFISGVSIYHAMTRLAVGVRRFERKLMPR